MSRFAARQQRASAALTILGIAGTVATAVLAAKATPKALTLVEKRKRELGTDDISAKEAAMASWRCYVPAALMGAATAACIVGIGAMDRKGQASLSSAYAMLRESYGRYRKAACNVYGKDADARIEAEMAADALVSADGMMVYSRDMDRGAEEMLFYDMLSERYFTSTMAAVLNAQYHVNRNLLLRGYAPLSEYYEFLGLSGTKRGDKLAWTEEGLAEGGLMWLDFENRMARMDDGLECCIVSAMIDPWDGWEDG